MGSVPGYLDGPSIIPQVLVSGRGGQRCSVVGQHEKDSSSHGWLCRWKRATSYRMLTASGSWAKARRWSPGVSRGTQPCWQPVRPTSDFRPLELNDNTIVFWQVAKCVIIFLQDNKGTKVGPHSRWCPLRFCTVTGSEQRVDEFSSSGLLRSELCCGCMCAHQMWKSVMSRALPGESKLLFGDNFRALGRGNHEWCQVN